MTIAVVAEKSGTKETKTNKKFSVWTLSDLNQAEVSPNTPFVVMSRVGPLLFGPCLGHAVPV